MNFGEASSLKCIHANNNNKCSTNYTLYHRHYRCSAYLLNNIISKLCSYIKMNITEAIVTRESFAFGVILEVLAVCVLGINTVLAATIIRFHKLKTDHSFILMFNIALSRSIGILDVLFHAGPEILFPSLFDSFDSNTFIETLTAFVFALCWYVTLCSKALISMHTFHQKCDNSFLSHLFTRRNMV